MDDTDLYIVDEEFLDTAQYLDQYRSDLYQCATDFLNILRYVCNNNSGQYIESIKDNIMNVIMPKLNRFDSDTSGWHDDCTAFISTVDQADDVVY
jgi:hypothetical protein